MAIARKPDERRIPPIEMVRMRRRHLRRVLVIEGRVYPRPWSASLFLSELSQRGTRSYIVARVGGLVVGYCGMMFTGPEAHVTNIAVDPDYQQAKIGSRLLLKQIIEAIARGAETISLEVRVSNVRAQQMYEKFGFSVVGVRKGYYVETGEDAYVMVVEDARSTDYRLRLRSMREEIEGELSGGAGG